MKYYPWFINHEKKGVRSALDSLGLAAKRARVKGRPLAT
jgi:hypothetical protein